MLLVPGQMLAPSSSRGVGRRGGQGDPGEGWALPCQGAVCKAQVAVGAGSKMAPRNRASALYSVSQHSLIENQGSGYTFGST
jgi:hypothetical protein